MRDEVPLADEESGGRTKPYEPPKVTELGDMAELTNYDVSVQVP